MSPMTTYKTPHEPMPSSNLTNVHFIIYHTPPHHLHFNSFCYIILPFFSFQHLFRPPASSKMSSPSHPRGSPGRSPANVSPGRSPAHVSPLRERQVSSGTSSSGSYSSAMSQGPTPTIYSRTYRVATDALRPLPLKNNPLPQDFFERDQALKVKQTVLDVLRKYGIQAPAPFDDLGPKEDLSFSGWETTFAPGKENEDYVSIVNRHHPGKPSPVCATIIIQSDWDSSSSHSWPLAAKEIFSSLARLEGRLPSLEVEIIATHLTRRVHVHPVNDNGEFATAWNGRLFKQVTDTLDMFPATKNMVNALAVSRLGFSYKADNNPITVYVAVDRRSNETRWPEVIKALQAPLGTFHQPIKVWIEHNNWEFPVFDLNVGQRSSDTQGRPSDKNDYRKKVNLGDEIGMGLYSPCVDGRTRTPGFGTLGCYVKVKKGRKWQTLALTNYHVVRPLFDGFELDLGEDKPFASKVTRQGTALYKADHEGVKTGQGQQLPGIEHPSRKTHIRILHTLQGQIEKEKARRPDGVQQKRLEAEYQAKKRFFDEGKHKFGQLWAASGFMRFSPAGHRMDWALIAPPADRIGANSLPNDATWDQWERDSDRPSTANKHSRLRGPSPKATLTLTKQDTLMFKMGARSGPTAAQYSKCKGCLGISESTYISDNRKTDEHYFVPCQPRESENELSLAVSGDSGAVVYDDEGKVVGLLFRGLAPQQISKGSDKFPYTYVTPIEDVFADIKAFTEADEVRLL